MYGIYANIGGIWGYIDRIHVTIYSIHGSYGHEYQLLTKHKRCDSTCQFCSLTAARTTLEREKGKGLGRPKLDPQCGI